MGASVKPAGSVKSQEEEKVPDKRGNR